MDTPFPPGSFVAHTATDVYGPGKVLDEEGMGDWRRVRFVHFVASVHVRDLRVDTTREAADVEFWLAHKKAKYGGQW
ncbi:hypothetical protein [Streptomyces sp. TRM64462]|uniref:hypothetical protein n=1 Tax=Streptomyces sp. TRM64462 TaxID=2741726 RepID=UPI00158679F3|nr:hypothetical protein [Streptomyces sp. TRM64462]